MMGKSSVRSFLLEQGLADEFIPVRAPWVDNRGGVGTRYIPVSPIWLKFFGKMLRLRRRRFDLAFVLSGKTDIRHNLTLWLTGARRRVGFGYAGGGFLLTDNVSPDLSDPNETALTLQLLKHLNIPPVGYANLLRVPSEDQEFAAKFLYEAGVKEGDLLIGLHPGARVPTRQWGGDRFRDVARQVMERYGAKILWFTDPAQPSVNSPNANFIPVSLPLRQFLAVLSRCQLVVCNESGPMHIAAGLGVPVVAVFGPQYPEWFSPVGNRHEVVIRRDVWCRPCIDQCIYPEPYCLSLISVDQVARVVLQKMDRLSFTAKNGVSIS
jgi:heptosyltransferase-2